MKEITPIEITTEMQQSYLDYAMSVIISRALPDARDGLKPVQRRILYAMYDMGIRPEGSFKKSARIVGEVLGKYHPHGDSAVYDAMARLAQDFTIRSPLVEGQGNFGSIDGDPPAAMRYTEAKLSKIAMELLTGLDQDTVDFTRNFDDTLPEPLILPAQFPHMLVNGANGIAVGMATNIPPHNLSEVIDAVVYLLKNWESYDDISTEDLMRFVQGPDFPTGGLIVNEEDKDEISRAYATGRGKLMVRGKVHLEDIGRGRNRIIITEIPYLINKTSLLERIAKLVRDGVLENITDLRDESDRQGMRIVIEVGKVDDPEDVIRKLYKYTPLQTTFGVIMLALVNNQPRVIGLKKALKVYIDHHLLVIERRTRFQLKKSEERAHIVAGLLVAVLNIDEVIAIIRASANEKEAREKLVARFPIDAIQAQAILDMALKRINQLEREKLQSEYDALQLAIQDMRELLASPAKMRSLLIENQLDIRRKYGDPRRTQIVTLGEGVSAKEVVTAGAMMESERVIVGVSKELKIGRVSIERANEKGFDLGRFAALSSTDDNVYLLNSAGKVIGSYVHTLPTVDSFAEGVDLRPQLLQKGDESAVQLFALTPGGTVGDEASILTVSQNGLIKRTLLSNLPTVSGQTFAICKVNPGDRIVAALITRDETDQVMLASSEGQAIRFTQDDLRPMGLIAAGVAGMKLADGATIAGAAIVSEKDSVAFATTDWGLGKIAVSEFPLQKRAGQGVMIAKLAAGEKIAGLTLMPSGKSAVLLHYGKQKTRSVRPAMIKAVRRAKALEYFIKLVNQTVTGITVVHLANSDQPAERKKDPKNSARAPEKPTVPKPETTQPRPQSETPDPPARAETDDAERAENDDQISLF